MNRDTLKKAIDLDKEISNLREMLKCEILYIWNDSPYKCYSHIYYTSQDIDVKLREILKNELEQKEKIFKEL